MSQHILVVDDEKSIITLLQYNLEQAGFTVSSASNGKDALTLAEAEAFDLIVLDLMLPEMDGIDVCKQLRQQQNFTPILMLTARNDEFDKVLGLELGADDYMTKPFSPREVVARIRAIFRRIDHQKLPPAKSTATVIHCGNLAIHPHHYEVYKNGELLPLTLKEFELLVYLAQHQGQVLTREQLLNAIWDYDFVGETRIVDVHISHLREKIEPNPKQPVYIKTIRGLGYKFEKIKESV